ncbi:hypothetical protein [Cognatiluteimonas weifangensis]|uniref:hypothetical protein n=1 Tax=Cognatiluteimonas weifangensis TaxID=2303539 RepID=UPI0011C17750|nr:hypothetical protein [Luteimonas weifangensis]
MRAFIITLLSIAFCAAATAGESSHFPSLVARARTADMAALREILAKADSTLPGEQLEELAELSSRYVTRAPAVFLRAQADRPACFGVEFLGADFTDNPAARTRERSARRKALESVIDPDLASAKARCLSKLAGS